MHTVHVVPWERMIAFQVAREYERGCLSLTCLPPSHISEVLLGDLEQSLSVFLSEFIGDAPQEYCGASVPGGHWSINL